PTSSGYGNSAQRLPEMGLHALGKIAVNFAKMPADDRLRTQPLGGVFAGLDHHQVRLAQHEQRPVRLDGTGELDLLALAVGEIGVAERWRLRVAHIHGLHLPTSASRSGYPGFTDAFPPIQPPTSCLSSASSFARS